LGGGSENTPAYPGQCFHWQSGLLQFITEATAQIPGAGVKHLPPTLGQPQAVVPGSSGNYRKFSENQRKEFEEEVRLRPVLVKIGPDCRQDLLAGHKNPVLRAHDEVL
jgi:hypothetical protein